MAGAGYKLFNTGDVLTAAQVNTYLQEQAVMRFANATARTTALSGVLSEGMMSYLDDTNSVEVYNGSAWTSVSGSVATSLGFTAGKNKIINGDFFINQRGFTSASNTSGFKFDRWDVSSFNTGTITDSAQTFTPGTAPVSGYEGATFYRVVTATGAGVSNYYFLRQKIESVRTLAGQTATISFWAKAGSGTPKIAVEISQDFGTGGSPSSAVNTYVNQVTLSTSWARYSVTVNVPSISGKTIGTTANTSSLQLNLWVTAGSNYNSRTGSLGIQDATFDIWGVQVEAGNTVTDFQTATGTLQGELAACQRYYYQWTASNAYSPFATGFTNTTSNAMLYRSLPVVMRITPTLTTSGTASHYAIQNAPNGRVACTSVPYIDQGNPDGCNVGFTTAAVLTTGQAITGNANNTTSAYLGFSAEL